jgi:hypothetical protein
MIRRLLFVFSLLVPLGCTVAHSRQALWTSHGVTPSRDATFVQEEDSGLSLFGLVQITEADHYAVLMERLRRRYRCSKVHHAQLDYFTDHWLLVAFPISRITAVCEPEIAAPAKAAP